MATYESASQGCRKGTRSLQERLFVTLPEDVEPGPESRGVADRVARLSVPTDLRSVVRHALVYRETLAPGEEVVEHVLPDASSRIFFDWSSAETPRGVVIGPSTTASIVTFSGRTEGLSITLTVSAARAVLGVPIADIAGKDCLLSELWGSVGTNLAARVMRSPDDLWDALRTRLSGAQPRLLPPALAAAAFSAPSHRELADAFGTGERRVQQVFRDHVGLSPRGYRRLVRFQRVLRMLRRGHRPGWADLAHQAGYCDQAHLCRDFRDLSGLTPTEYAAATSR
jgi:AraC-like DNA-binding protein